LILNLNSGGAIKPPWESKGGYVFSECDREGCVEKKVENEET
jgi:hypothetical protein